MLLVVMTSMLLLVSVKAWTLTGSLEMMHQDPSNVLIDQGLSGLSGYSLVVVVAQITMS